MIIDRSTQQQHSFHEETKEGKCVDWIDDFEHLSMDDYLDSDPVDNHGDASFTGVWTAAKGLIQYLQESTSEPKNVLEVGAGTGWLGITIGRNCPSIEHLVLTDSSRTGAVQWTQSNVEAAQKQGLPHMDRIQVVPMDWTREEQVETVAGRHSFDLMVGSDLIYSEDRIEPLAQTIATLLGKQQQQDRPPRFLYGHTQGRMPEMDQLWEQELKAHGMTWTVLKTIPQWDQRKTVIMEISRRAGC